MTEEPKRPLKVFLCHASGDKPIVRDLYRRLVAEGVDAWLDQEKLMPGQDWQLEIPRAVREADVVVVCVSNRSVTKEGFIQKEIRFALDSAKEKPEGTIFLIPVRLEECVVPERLRRWQWVDLFEDNGFLRLLHSLKLRADKVGAVIGIPSYEGEDKEVEKRLEQLYTNGLAAFYTEDWDRACRSFEAILRERPSHKNAAEKLVQAERQRNLAKLYAQATEAYELENWSAAIKALEDLLAKSADYKDAVQLLKNARKQKQLKELYVEAKALHTAEKWQAVVRVFEKISVIEPDYPDPDGLLTSAQKEVVELKRLNELNELYSHGVREMDAGKWYEARRLLEQAHKAQTGFLETERLLRKVDHEITKVEELKKRDIQVNTLYEQAHGLVRSKNWREALEKIEEIHKLDNQFEDKDEIAKKAKAVLAREEQEAQKQNQLAAMYVEVVRLLRKESIKKLRKNGWKSKRLILNILIDKKYKLSSTED
jgi:outer membrane protein assembly factor BamD (BamD/ComL family)